MKTLHLETDASLNTSRSMPAADGSIVCYAGGGIVLRDPTLKVNVARSAELGYFPSATHAEHTALLIGVEIALSEGARALFVRVDNQAVAEQYRGTWRARSPGIPRV